MSLQALSEIFRLCSVLFISKFVLFLFQPLFIKKAFVLRSLGIVFFLCTYIYLVSSLADLDEDLLLEEKHN